MKLKNQYHGKDLTSDCLPKWKLETFCCFKNLLKDTSFVVNLVSGLAILIVSINWVIRFTYCKILTWDKSFGNLSISRINEKCMRVLWSLFIRKLFLRPKMSSFLIVDPLFWQLWNLPENEVVQYICSTFMLYLKAI